MDRNEVDNIVSYLGGLVDYKSLSGFEKVALNHLARCLLEVKADEDAEALERASGVFRAGSKGETPSNNYKPLENRLEGLVASVESLTKRVSTLEESITSANPAPVEEKPFEEKRQDLVEFYADRGCHVWAGGLRGGIYDHHVEDWWSLYIASTTPPVDKT